MAQPRRTRVARGLLCFGLLLWTLPAFAGDTEDELMSTFRRGDVNADGSLNLSDSLGILNFMFREFAPAVECDKAFDVNDDGNLSIGDPIFHLSYLFTEGSEPAAPFGKCGEDLTEDDLTCVEYNTCKPVFDPAVLEKIKDVVHVLNRVAFGQTPDLFDRVMELEDGVEGYVEEQLDPESIDEGDNELLDDLLGDLDPETSLRDLYSLQLVRAIYSERQLQEVMTDFWEQHFNTYVFTVWGYFLRQATDSLGFIYTSAEALELATFFEHRENQLFREHALGNFEDLLLASATSPAMLIYLDNVSNAVGNPNENYGREILELHSVGVGNHSQADVEAVARIFTGWGVCLVDEEDADDPLAECQDLVADPAAEGLVWAFHFSSDRHDYGAKTIFENLQHEYEIDAGGEDDAEAGLQEGLDFIAHLAEVGQTAEFLAEKLVHKFVRDEGHSSLQAKLLSTYLTENGDMGEVLAELFADARFMREDFRWNKMKTPFEFVVSATRAFKGETEADSEALLDALVAMTNVPFNFLTPDGYPEAGADQLGTASILERINYNKNIYNEDDDVDFDNVKRIMIDSDVALNDADAVVEFWMERLFPGVHNDTEKELAVEFLETNALGEFQQLSSAANLYERRVQELLAYLASYPMFLKQ